MNEKLLMILERSSSNLQKITKNGKTILEGVFAEFGVENRNGRIYEEKEYLPHLEYLKKDIANNNLLGELDHPERFEVALGNVSHRISELWYDQAKRQVLGRIEILDTPKGQIAKSLLEAGIPLSISSRAAGTVNEDKTVQIQQIYTYDLVAKPGFESAQLHSVNESANPKVARIANLVKRLNESYNKHEEENLSSKLGIINENVSILDLSDKFPSVNLREEARELLGSKKENKETKTMTKPELTEDKHLQEWTLYFKNELSKLNERLDKIEADGAASKEIKVIKEYVEKLRRIQEESLNWQSEIAVAVNKVGNFADELAEKSNTHYELTNKIVETVDYNAKTLNKTQDWVGSIATMTNAIGSTVDHNAKMLNGINEWNTEIAQAVNKLNEWNEEIAPAVNGMHEWTSSIAKNLNSAVNWTEEQLNETLSKEEATKLKEYIELVAESKQDPELKNKIEEMLKVHAVEAKPLNEKKELKGIKVIDSVGKVGDVKVDTDTKLASGVEFDKKTNTIISKIRSIKLKKEGLPKGLKDDLQMELDKEGGNLPKDDGCCNDPKDLQTGLKKTKTIKSDSKEAGMGPKKGYASAQNLKLNVKPGGKGLVNEENIDRTEEIQARKSNLSERLERITQDLEKERVLDESIKSEFPFTGLLSADDRKRFNDLAPADKTKVAYEVSKVPTTDPTIIMKLWESALVTGKAEEPLWLKAAPKEYKELFENAPEALQESIKARAEFYALNTDYQIANFWETSGLVHRPTITLNESVIAKPITKDEELKVDDFVAQVGEQLRRYNN